MIIKNCKSGIHARTYIFVAMLTVLLAASFSCNTQVQKTDINQDIHSLSVTSTAFKDGELIPDKYTCWGENTSPLLTWTEGPKETKYYVLVVENLDAPDGITGNWILYNIPGDVTMLHDGISTNGILDTGAIQGRNYLRKLGYYGPCPKQSGTYRFRFTVYAVDKYITLSAANREQILTEIEGHILASGQLIGIYKM